MKRARLALALAVAGGLSLVVAGATPASAAGTSSDAASVLAQRYAPVVRLVDRSGACGNAADFEPTDVNAVLGSPLVALRGPWSVPNLVKVAPTAEDLSVGLPGYNLDFPGNALSPGCTYADWARDIAKTSPPTVYAHVATEANQPGKLALQYWFFYIYNDWNNRHEGDWENIQLLFNASDAHQALDTSPYAVGYSQHESSERAAWGSGKLQLIDGTHPVVYPSMGSHANYYSANLYLGRSAAQGVGCDDTVGPSRQIRPQVEVIPQSQADYLGAFPWLGYDGRWGERQRGFFNGPTGPNDKASWTQPITVAETSWRDTSYSVPEGAHIGRPATEFFCSAIGWGSTALTAAVNDPSPTLLVLSALIVVLIWIMSRTQWRPSAPLHLGRRRAWGSLVTSGYRMYAEHPRLYLGIGLLFIPIGVLTAGLQYLLFNVGTFSPLVDSVGRTNGFVEFLVFALEVLTALIGLTIVQATTAIAMTELDAGRSIRAWPAYRLAFGKMRPLLRALAVAIVVILLLEITVIGIVVGIWLVIRWSLLAQAVTMSPPATASRPLRFSAALTRRHWWKTASITGFVAGIGLLVGPMFGVLLLFVTSASFGIVDLTSSLINVAVLPFVAITTTYLYCDLAVRARLTDPKPALPRVLPSEIALGQAPPPATP
ncbi:MAG TPA: hypothetical protein VMH41_05910 [Mycobacteriales bacterium]|nr:hypothetical protein [Mycobacteriales bacterium]